MTAKKWFRIPLGESTGELVGSTLIDLGFSFSDGEHIDGQGRSVRIVPPYLHIGIPASDTVSEQEQLEYLVGLLGLDEDNIEAL